jgi:hypothetical protein
MTFYLQVHDLTKSNEDDRITAWYGATVDTSMYEVEDLVRAGNRHGLIIGPDMQRVLYGEKDEGA